MAFLLFFLGLCLFIAIIVVATRSTAAKISDDEPIKVKVVSITKRWAFHTVLFETEDKKRITIDVYGNLLFTVGDVGMLTYHKTEFKSFNRLSD